MRLMPKIAPKCSVNLQTNHAQPDFELLPCCALQMVEKFSPKVFAKDQLVSPNSASVGSVTTLFLFQVLATDELSPR